MLHQQQEVFDFAKESFPVAARTHRKAAQNERHELKKQALELLGGKCICCGYKGVALEFHHRDPKLKKFTISEGIFRALPWEDLKQEVLKCVLLCANHHREFHAGVCTLPNPRETAAPRRAQLHKIVSPRADSARGRLGR